jgi:hypothetical protein
MNPRCSSVVLLAALALIPRPAQADPSATDKATARALALEAIQALDEKKDFAGALERFKRADALYHAPTLTLGQARAYVGLGRWVEALAVYSQTMHEALPPNPSQAFIEAVQAATTEHNALSPRIPTVIVNVTGAKDPSVTIDGTAVPSAALGVKRPVDPGKHVIRATAPGYVTAEATVMSVEGKGETIPLELKAMAPPPPVPKVESKAPSPVVKPGPSPYGAAQVAAPVGSTVGPAKEKSRTSNKTILASVAFGVGGVGAILGTIGAALAANEYSELKVKCTGGRCPPESSGALDAYHVSSGFARIGFVIGGVGVAAGVIILLVPDTAPSRPIVTLVPRVGPGVVGLDGLF